MMVKLIAILVLTRLSFSMPVIGFKFVFGTNSHSWSGSAYAGGDLNAQSWSGSAYAGGDLNAQSWSGSAYTGGDLDAQSWSGSAAT